MKICTKCGLPKSDFYRDSTKRDGLRPSCKDCDNETIATYQATEQGKSVGLRASRKFRWKTQYGMTPEDVEQMVVAQSWRCRVCREPLISFQVDHDHSCCPGKESCGKCIRGLLCGNCNKLLGMAHDSVLLLQQAIAYLEAQ